MTEELTKDIGHAIKWLAAEFKFLKEFYDDLKKIEEEDLEQQEKDLKKDKRVVRYIGKSERRVGKDIKEIIKEIKEKRKEEVSQEELNGILKEIEIPANQLLKEGSLYVGKLKNELNTIRTSVALEKKYPKKENQVLVQQEIGTLKNKLKDLVIWVTALDAALKKVESITDELSVKDYQDKSDKFCEIFGGIPDIQDEFYFFSLEYIDLIKKITDKAGVIPDYPGYGLLHALKDKIKDKDSLETWLKPVLKLKKQVDLTYWDDIVKIVNNKTIELETPKQLELFSEVLLSWIETIQNQRLNEFFVCAVEMVMELITYHRIKEVKEIEKLFQNTESITKSDEIKKSLKRLDMEKTTDIKDYIRLPIDNGLLTLSELNEKNLIKIWEKYGEILSKYLGHRYFNSDWDLKDLVAIRADDTKFGTRAVDSHWGKKVIYAAPKRSTIHFTLNHLVTAHAYGSWEGSDQIYIIPLKDLYELNRENLVGGTSVDLFFVGFVRLPKSTKILYREIGEPSQLFEERVKQEIVKKGFFVMPGGHWQIGEGVMAMNLIAQWWKKLCGEYGLESDSHTASGYDQIDQEAIARYKSTKNIREEIIKNYQKEFPRYFKFLNAWNSYWNKKGL